MVPKYYAKEIVVGPFYCREEEDILPLDDLES